MLEAEHSAGLAHVMGMHMQTVKFCPIYKLQKCINASCAVSYLRLYNLSIMIFHTV